jgi:hypothetical protein
MSTLPASQPYVGAASTMDSVGMNLGMNWGLTGHLMPTSDDLWYVFAQVVAL